MKRGLWLASGLFFLVLSVCPALGQEPPRERAISLRVLQERIKTCQKERSCPEEILQLGGLTRMMGYVVDEAHKDVILVGQVEAGRPPLYLEDWVVALRNSFLKYAVLKGRTYEYSDPGCSIDPDRLVIQKLVDLGEQIFRSNSPEDIVKGIEAWQRICKAPQEVKVLGIPFDTRFARVMVKADYDMKKLVDGTDSLNLAGFSSLMDLNLEKAKREVLQGRPVSVSLWGMNRFWFYPGKNCYEEDQGVAVITRSPVVLLTEEEALNKRGERAGTGQPNPVAKKFAENFTARYADVARQRPIYAELENLFRSVALARMIKLKSPHQKAGLDLTYLLDHFPVPQTSVHRQLPGCSNVKEFQHKQDVPGGYRVAHLWIPTCGGVLIEVHVDQKRFIKNTTGRLSSWKATALKTRPSPAALFWELPHGHGPDPGEGSCPSKGYY